MIITAAAPVLGSLVDPSDPYLLQAAFPWLLLAPLAVALQHGLWAGLVSSSLLVGLAALQVMNSGSLPDSFLSWAAGCALCAVSAGQIRDSVRGRTRELEGRADELQDRLERSERTRHLIQLSHSKLEERVAVSRSSLSGAIDDATRRLARAHSMQEIGQVVLDVLATQGHMHAASLYIAGRDPGLLMVEPVASFGGTGASSARHPLVERAWTGGKLAAVVDGGFDEARTDGSVLAAVPLITARRKTVGVVAVHHMPFMVFHAEHLNQVFVLAGHLADMLFDRWTQLHEEVALPESRLVSESFSSREERTTTPVAIARVTPVKKLVPAAEARRVVEVIDSPAESSGVVAIVRAEEAADGEGEEEPASVVGVFEPQSVVVQTTRIVIGAPVIEIEIDEEAFEGEDAGGEGSSPSPSTSTSTTWTTFPAVVAAVEAEALRSANETVAAPEPVVEAPKPEPVVEALKPEPVIEAAKPEPVVEAPVYGSLAEALRAVRVPTKRPGAQNAQTITAAPALATPAPSEPAQPVVEAAQPVAATVTAEAPRTERTSSAPALAGKRSARAKTGRLPAAPAPAGSAAFAILEQNSRASQPHAIATQVQPAVKARRTSSL